MKQIIKNILKRFGYRLTRIGNNKSTNKTLRSDELSLYDTPTGKYYLPTHAYGDIIVKSIIKGEVFEKEVVNLAFGFIKEDTAVLDIGSNFGQMAVLFAGKVGAKGKVYAFDADDFVFSVLKKNIAINGLTEKINATFGAVHNQDGIKLYFPEQDFVRYNTYGSYGIDYKNNVGREVPSLTIDSLQISEPISFMKVDVQGGDLNAMQGAKQTILKNRMPILFEYEYHFEDELNLCFQDYVDFVAEIGYKFEKVINGHNFLIVPK